MTTINLATLTAAQGFKLIGPATNSLAGFSVGNAGDVNGDGLDDLFVGVPNEVSAAGGLHVVYGQLGGITGPLTLGTLSATQGFTVYGGSVGDFAGSSTAGIGDVTSDGRDDLLIGVTGANGFNGAAVVVRGQAGNINGPLSTGTLTPGQGVRFDSGATGAMAGYQVSAAGDVNHDGIGDLIIGAGERAGGVGAAYIVYGGASAMGPFNGFTLDTMPTAEGFRLDGDGNPTRIRLGRSSGGIGDFNHDGIDDLAVGAPGGDGAVFVVYGQAGARPNLALGGLTTAQGFRIDGGFNWTAGTSLAAAGDVNADGIDDLILGAPGANNFDGAAYVIYGVAGGLAGPLDLTTPLTAAQGFAINGGAGFVFTGGAVAGVGDVNGDGIDDVAVSSYGPSSTHAGTVSVVYGMAGTRGAVSLPALTDAEGFTALGLATGARAGFSLAAAGDVNQDGFADIILGAAWDNSSAGGAYVIYGFAPSDTCIGTAAPDTCTGAGGDDLLVGLGGDDTLTGNGGEDTLLGGAGNDLLDGGANNDLLDGDLGADTLLGGAGTDVMKGGKGNDVYEVDDAGDLAIELPGQGIDLVLASLTFTLGADLEDLTLTGVANIDGTGNAAANSLLGNAGNNSLAGLGGDDLLDGGAGVDSLSGGLGNDTYLVDTANDLLTELAGQGTDLVVASVSYSLVPRPAIENLTLTGSAISGTGNNLANLLIGNAADNVLKGGGGADTIEGGAGRDKLTGSGGADLFRFVGPVGLGQDDRVLDFVSGVDRVEISRMAIDPGLSSGLLLGPLAGQAGRFSVGAPSGAQAQFTLLAGDMLYWDVNGTGGGIGVLLVDFNAPVAATDIVIIA
jgi:hypothetical protein